MLIAASSSVPLHVHIELREDGTLFLTQYDSTVKLSEQLDDFAKLILNLLQKLLYVNLS